MACCLLDVIRFDRWRCYVQTDCSGWFLVSAPRDGEPVKACPRCNPPAKAEDSAA